ncbi:hypothetical protein NDU88_005785 [Pleurodeles waltl]|uniref:Uncharacterized protein n=1 Tax=Pleurodeles waltl TaxID=8319 RepID=A0AAV7QJ91_PLEWA|nr:hypothetical protein NDU88_005785 [Pleurodeles waltl]
MEKTETLEEMRTTEKMETLKERKWKKMERNGRRQVESQETQDDVKTKPDLSTTAREQQRGRVNADNPGTGQLARSTAEVDKGRMGGTWEK